MCGNDVDVGLEALSCQHSQAVKRASPKEAGLWFDRLGSVGLGILISQNEDNQ